MTDEIYTGGWKWLRGLPRTFVLGLCAVVLAAVQGILAVLAAPTWVRVLAAVLILVVAVASEVDKWRTKQREKAEADQKRAAEVEQAEAQWLKGIRASIWAWPLPAVGDTTPRSLIDIV